MLGVYDYTVILTYLSFISAGAGILITLNGSGHPFIGAFFLMICGLLDAFDGRVARSKKNRTEFEQKFGIQIDSLCDLVAFGVLPGCIGNAMARVCPTLSDMPQRGDWTSALFFAIMLIYMLCALIRLAYFNVAEEERQKKEGGNRKYFEGLPVTSAALIFPSVLLFHYIVPVDLTWLYFGTMILTAIAFVLKFHLPKPGLRGIIIMLIIGALEFVALGIALHLHIR